MNNLQVNNLIDNLLVAASVQNCFAIWALSVSPIPFLFADSAFPAQLRYTRLIEGHSACFGMTSVTRPVNFSSSWSCEKPFFKADWTSRDIMSSLSSSAPLSEAILLFYLRVFGYCSCHTCDNQCAPVVEVWNPSTYWLSSLSSTVAVSDNGLRRCKIPLPDLASVEGRLNASE